MKTGLPTILIFLICSNYSLAQNWALPSSRWVRTEFNPWDGSISPITYFVEKDTLIQAIHCAKIKGEATIYGDFIYTYSSGDTAYVFVNGYFEPMLYFAAHVGDTLLFHTDGNGAYASIPHLHGTVDSINTIAINGQNLKQFHVSIIDTTPSYIFPRQITYTEKIGFDVTYPYAFFQIFSTVVDANSYGACTYGDSTITRFWLYSDSACSTHVGIDDVTSDQSLDIYPNPTSNYLHISTNLHSYQINIFDPIGQLLSCIKNGNDVDVHLLSSGIYFLILTQGNQYRAVRKFIKK